jgi:hypothetical protein
VLRPIDPITLGFNYKLKPAVFRPEIPQVLVEFSPEGSALLQNVSSVLDVPTTVAADEVLLADTIEVSDNLNVVGNFVSFGTAVFGDGSIFGTGNVQ